MSRRHDDHDTEPVEERLRQALTELTDTTETADDAWARINERARELEPLARRTGWLPGFSWIHGRRAAALRGVSATVAVGSAVALVAALVVARSGSDGTEVAAGGGVRFDNVVALQPAVAPDGFQVVEEGGGPGGRPASLLVCTSYHREADELVCDEVDGTFTRTFSPSQGAGFSLASIVVTTSYEDTTHASITARADNASDVAAFDEVTVRGSSGYYAASERSVFEGLMTGGEAAEETVDREVVFEDATLAWIEGDGIAVAIRSTSDGAVPTPLARDQLVDLADGLEEVPIDANTPVPFVVAGGETEALSLNEVPAEFLNEPPAAVYEFESEALEEQSGRWRLLATDVDGQYCVDLEREGTFPICSEGSEIEQDSVSLFNVTADITVDGQQIFYGATPERARAVLIDPAEGDSVEVDVVGGDLGFDGRFFHMPVPTGSLSVVALDADGVPIGEAVRVVVEEGQYLPDPPHVFTGPEETLATGEVDGRAWELVARPTNRGFCFGLAYGEASPDQCVPKDLVGGEFSIGVAFQSTDPPALVGIVGDDAALVKIAYSDGRLVDEEVRVGLSTMPETGFFAVSLPDGVAVDAVGKYDADGNRLGSVSVYSDPLPLLDTEPPMEPAE